MMRQNLTLGYRRQRWVHLYGGGRLPVLRMVGIVLVLHGIADLMGIAVPQTALEEEDPLPQVAFINENMCIGCTKCIQACPVDAIIGTNRSVHTVIPDLCTGCTLCVAPCPTDCISMKDIKPSIQNWNWQFDPKLIIPVVDTTSEKK